MQLDNISNAEHRTSQLIDPTVQISKELKNKPYLSLFLIFSNAVNNAMTQLVFPVDMIRAMIHPLALGMVHSAIFVFYAKCFFHSLQRFCCEVGAVVRVDDLMHSIS